ncbi:contact-dependent growth inhibition system immunity protein [Streptomyces lavendulae]|uniref:contact-dependent growth inhibition system immunity protein n=1 Tax=Streptomyces lavendulae TaxID=1914 RepID=UPI00382A550E
MPIDFNPDRSIQELEGDDWGNPPEDSTGLVQAVYTLRRRPLSRLSAYELGRLIGQDVGLRWTLPLALKVLRDTVDDHNRVASTTMTYCQPSSAGNPTHGRNSPNWLRKQTKSSTC